MKEYGEIESDLKIVQQLCKWPQFKYVETAWRASKQRKMYLIFYCSGSSNEAAVSAQRVG